MVNAHLKLLHLFWYLKKVSLTLHKIRAKSMCEYHDNKSESHYRSERNQFSCKFKQVSDNTETGPPYARIAPMTLLRQTQNILENNLETLKGHNKDICKRSLKHPWNFLETSFKHLDKSLKTFLNTCETSVKHSSDYLETPMNQPWSTIATQ